MASLCHADNSLLREVSRLLCSSKLVLFHATRPPEISDHDFEQRKQASLLLACTRSFATAAGRGMITFRSLPSLSTLAEVLLVSD